MGLKSEIYKLSDGTKITVKEMSFAGQMRLDETLNERGHLNMVDLYKECMSPWEKMEEIGKDEGKELLNLYRKLNPIETHPESNEGVGEQDVGGEDVRLDAKSS